MLESTLLSGWLDSMLPALVRLERVHAPLKGHGFLLHSQRGLSLARILKLNLGV